MRQTTDALKAKLSYRSSHDRGQPRNISELPFASKPHMSSLNMPLPRYPGGHTVKAESPTPLRLKSRSPPKQLGAPDIDGDLYPSRGTNSYYGNMGSIM